MAQSVQTGLFQWIKWGPSASPSTSMGVVDGGSLTLDPGTRKRIGLGGQVIRKGGMVNPSGTATFYITNTNIGIFSDHGQRATYPNGALAEIFIDGGAEQWRLAYLNSLISDFSIDYAVGEGLKGTINWMAKGVTPATTTQSSYPTETEDGFEDYECVITVGGASYAVQSFSIKVNNNVSAHTSADAKGSNVKRFPERLLYGAEDLTVGVSSALPPSMATLGTYIDCMPDDLAAVITCTGACSSDVITFTLSNLMQSDPLSMGFVDHATAAAWDYGFIGDPQDGSLVIATA